MSTLEGSRTLSRMRCVFRSSVGAPAVAPPDRLARLSLPLAISQADARRLCWAATTRVARSQPSNQVARQSALASMVGGCHPQAPLDCQLCEAPEARAVPYAVESLPVSRDPPSPPGRHDDGPLAGCPPKLDAGAGSRESPPAGAHLGCAPCRGKCGLLGAWFGPQSPPSTHRAQSSGGLGGLRPLPRPYCAISARAAVATKPALAARPPAPRPLPPPRVLLAPCRRLGTVFFSPDGGPGGWSRHPPLCAAASRVCAALVLAPPKRVPRPGTP